MSLCAQHRSEEIELYFYDELAPAERDAVERHVRSCLHCRRTLDDLAVIRTTLAAQTAVDAPPAGDWTPFMNRLQARVAAAPVVVSSRGGVLRAPVSRSRRSYVPYLTMAALVTLVTSGVVFVARSTSPRAPSTSERPNVATSDPAVSRPTAVAPPVVDAGSVAGFAALSEEHFERSKLVILGLANKDALQATAPDWAYERGLASDLLSDTRLYRLAAEDRGFKKIAGVMGDLEIVLLQAALADATDGQVLQQIQRAINKRDLVTKLVAPVDSSTLGF